MKQKNGLTNVEKVPQAKAALAELSKRIGNQTYAVGEETHGYFRIDKEGKWSVSTIKDDIHKMTSESEVERIERLENSKWEKTKRSTYFWKSLISAAIQAIKR